MLKIKKFTFGPFQENTFLLWDESNEATIFDPGCSNTVEEQQLVDFLSSHDLRLTQLLYTHCHIDHVLGNAFVTKQFGLEPRYHRDEEQVMELAKISAQMYGISYEEGPRCKGDYLQHGDEVQIGAHSLRCILCPGHSPGSIVFYDGAQLAIGGDVLFRDSIGRTDLPGGDHDQLLRSISENLYILDDEVNVFPGHGPKTSIGYEKRNNPFVQV